MKKQMRLVILLAIILVSCTSDRASVPAIESPVPTVELARKNDFGDGYIAHVLIRDVSSETPEMLIRLLVTQWPEHYTLGSTAEQADIEDFQIGEITLLERMKNDPSIVASVGFSIIPSQIPNDWASFPGEEITLEDRWWHLYAPFGVYQDRDYYWLKLMFGRGT